MSKQSGKYSEACNQEEEITDFSEQPAISATPDNYHIYIMTTEKNPNVQKPKKKNYFFLK